MSVLCYHNVMAKNASFRLADAAKGWMLRTLALVTGSLIWQTAKAATFDGGGLREGIGFLKGIGGISNIGSLHELILALIAWVLDITLLLATAVVIIAGLYLIFSNGDEGNKDKAKHIVTYCIVGIVLIIFARAIVVAVNHMFG
jgi:hypothetical protein